MNYNRKHTGTANMDTKVHMSDQIKSAEKYYNRLIADKEYLKTITLDCKSDDFQVKGGTIWDGKYLYNLYQEGSLPWEWHKELFDYAAEQGITLFSSPFDETAVDLLQELNAPAYKIASFELIDLPLIKRAAECGKPLLMSTGMASVIEVAEALDVAIKYGCGDVLLFHCISSYPAPITDSNLKNIEFLRKEFGVEVGLSDHTTDSIAAISSIALGACMVEKHFTLDNSAGGPDDFFSMEPDDLMTVSYTHLTLPTILLV